MTLRKPFSTIIQAIRKQLLGSLFEDSSPEKYLTVRYNDLLAPMIKAIQEQQKTITAQQQSIIQGLRISCVSMDLGFFS